MNLAVQPATLEPDYLTGLNSEQREAVLATEGPVLVLAGAGTGKTRVLTTRLAHILASKRAFPGQMLAVTFTNKAAREMSERVSRYLGDSAAHAGLWLGTFHSIGARILRRHAEAIGLKSDFTILDADDQLRLIKQLHGELGIDDGRFSPKYCLAAIQRWKDQGLVPAQAKADEGQEKIRRLYEIYQQRLLSLNAADFGDLLLHNLTLFTKHPEIGAEYGQRFRYILVDEYQDTNVAQYLWLRLLAIPHKNICCVGDDDQSIYSWRGAEVGNILRFEKDFPNAKIIRLECNYRSTRSILKAASGLIAHNEGRLGKELWTESNEDFPVRLRGVRDDTEEARIVVEEVMSRAHAGEPLASMAVLVRAGFQTRAFEERCMAARVPYRVIGGLRFYERQEVRDALAYARLLVNPSDDLAFTRIINTPKRGLGKATLDLLARHGRESHICLMEAAERLSEAGAISGKAGNSLKKLLADFGRWRALLANISHPEAVSMMLEESGYLAMWKSDPAPDSAGRVENLKEFVQAMTEFETLPAYLEHVSLVTDVEEGEQADMLGIMTLHAAKGLEFMTVFLPGWEEGLFPHPRALEEQGTKGLEEERRLAYVGITRARKNLLITHASSRRIFNQWQYGLPSRFLDEIPEEAVERHTQMTSAAKWREEAEAVVRAARGEDAIGKGARIFHDKFGYGTVLAREGDHLTIRFDKAGEKKVIARFVQIAV